MTHGSVCLSALSSHCVIQSVFILGSHESFSKGFPLKNARNCVGQARPGAQVSPAPLRLINQDEK